MIDVNDLRKGVTFELDGTLYKVLEYEHHKPGMRKATIRTKARNLRTGTILASLLLLVIAFRMSASYITMSNSYTPMDPSIISWIWTHTSNRRSPAKS